MPPQAIDREVREEASREFGRLGRIFDVVSLGGKDDQRLTGLKWANQPKNSPQDRLHY